MSRPINFTDTTVTKKPYVEINGNEYEVQDGTYQGGTDLNANTFNTMQDELNVFRNMLNIFDGTYTSNDVTYIAKDGVLTYSSGTPAGDVNIGINITPFTLKAGTYTMSNNSGRYPYIFLYSGDTKVVESEYANNGVKTFTIENETTINKVYLYFGQSTPPASVKPQIEEGTKKTNYTPFIPDNVKNAINGTNWVDITCQGTYSNFDANNYNKFQYKQIGNQVFLRGLLKNSSIPTSLSEAVAGILPTLARPSKNVYLIASQNSTPIECSITDYGAIRLMNTATDTWISADGLSFFID